MVQSCDTSMGQGDEEERFENYVSIGSGICSECLSDRDVLWSRTWYCRCGVMQHDNNKLDHYVENKLKKRSFVARSCTTVAVKRCIMEPEIHEMR